MLQYILYSFTIAALLSQRLDCICRFLLVFFDFSKQLTFFFNFYSNQKQMLFEVLSDL